MNSANAVIRITGRPDKESALASVTKRDLAEVLEARDVAQDSSNFWKWLALTGWIFAALAVVLVLVPIR